MMIHFSHTPALLKETLELLSPKENKTYVDATLGGGGHSRAILEAVSGKVRLIGIDKDGEAISAAEGNLSEFKGAVTFVRDDFVNIRRILKSLGIDKIDGIVFDLGISSYQIDKGERGFSLRRDGPLDMRMNGEQRLSAREIVNSSGPEELTRIIREFGEEPLAKKLAMAITNERKRQEINSTGDLVRVIEVALAGLPPKRKLDAVTRVFQAIRISVNNEMGNLSKALSEVTDLLNKRGRIVVISYHSLEDRIVKDFFRKESTDCVCEKSIPVCVCSHKRRLTILTKKPVRPSAAETAANTRARSAKMRAAERA